jgi:hypothetical protein
MFESISTDLLPVIRSYLYAFRFAEGDDVDEFESFVRQDSERSWRNFLVASNSKSWRTMRKETRIWCLNERNFRKYLTNDVFRKYLNDRMANPSQQLHCRLYNGVKVPNLNSKVAEIVGNSNIGCINIRGYCLPELSFSRSLRTLSLGWCYFFERLGDFPGLEILHLRECPGLKTVGKMDNLIKLHLTNINESAISQFPLERLEKFVVFGSAVKNFPNYSHRLKSLKDLHLTLPSSSDGGCDFIAQNYPFLNTLFRLRLDYFEKVDLIGLVHLRHLALEGTVIRGIFGKELVYAHLKSFSWITDTSRGDTVEFSRTKVRNLSEFVDTSPTSAKYGIMFPVQSELRSLTISVGRLNLSKCSARKPFRKAELLKSYLPDYSAFTNVQMLHLQECWSLSDISPFKDVPFLQLEILMKVKDFSCLGNQKYLKIAQCPGLTDEAVSHFGNVYHLCIVGCSIGVVKGLTHNRFLKFESNVYLKEVYLTGKDYILVCFQFCGNQMKVHLTGRIYSLEFTENTICNTADLRRKCNYLNGEEIPEMTVNSTIEIRKYLDKRFSGFLLLTITIAVLSLFFKQKKE